MIIEAVGQACMFTIPGPTKKTDKLKWKHEVTIPWWKPTIWGGRPEGPPVKCPHARRWQEKNVKTERKKKRKLNLLTRKGEDGLILAVAEHGAKTRRRCVKITHDLATPGSCRVTDQFLHHFHCLAWRPSPRTNNSNEARGPHKNIHYH